MWSCDKFKMAATDVVNSLQREVELVKEGLKGVDEDIKKLTGRDPSEMRGPIGNRRVPLKRNFAERIGGPAPKRFNSRSAYSRLGPVPSSNNREQRYRKLESDGEDEEDDDKKPTLQSSVVATPAPSRLKQETLANADKKTQTRNKRMFGVLLGTLQKFKETSNKEAARERRRQEIEKKLEEAAAKEKEEAIRQKKELFSARKEKQRKLENLEKKIEAAEELGDWEAHDWKLTKFIRTKTKPFIFYLPVKHNDCTLDLLEKTAKHLEGEIKKRREELVDVVEKPGAELNDAVETKNGNSCETHEGEQDTVGKQDLGDNEEHEDEGNVRGNEEKVGGGREEGEVKDEKTGEGKEKREGRGKVEEREGRGEVEENEEAEVNERKEEGGEIETKEENIGAKEEVKQDQDEPEIMQTDEEAVTTVDDKEKDTATQVDFGPNDAE